MPRILRPSATSWLAAAVLILLPLLAVLQYRWLSQIGEEAGVRMQAVAANAGAALARDLTFEVGRAWRERAGIGGTIDAEGAGTAPSLVVDALVINRSRRVSRTAAPAMGLRRADLRGRRLAGGLRDDPRGAP